MLTARTEESDKLVGLELGADGAHPIPVRHDQLIVFDRRLLSR